jgi:hypothetical protein
MSNDLTALIASLAQHRLSLFGGEGAPFIKRAIGEVDPVELAKTIRKQLDEGPSGRGREDTPAYQALSGITSYWRGMLAFAPKDLPWADPPPLILALREECLAFLLADEYFTDDKWGQSALSLHLAPLAAAVQDELFTKVKGVLERVRAAGGIGGEDATNALRGLHFESTP